MAKRAQLAAPEVGARTRLEDEPAGRLIGDKALELAPREPFEPRLRLAMVDDRDLEGVLGQINRYNRESHGSSWSFPFQV
jgi:hypothetical protein